MIEDEVLISLHALSGCNSFRTMRVVGTVKGQAITILIDSGSTHNFVDPWVAKVTDQTVVPTPELPVTVADGTKLCSTGVCKSLTWTMQGQIFKADARVLAIGGCDMVLGVQWLSTLGPILWDFTNLQMQFQLQ